MDKIVELLKSINYQISRELLFNYKKLNLTDSEFIIIIYLINQQNNIYNPKQISNDLNFDLNNVLELINSLCEKNLIKIQIVKTNNIRNEVINTDFLYEKLAFKLKDSEVKTDSNVYDMFESEFGRTLSPLEFEIITTWLDKGLSEDLIKLALKEATYNGIRNFNYIDKIIYEWSIKGIKTKDDVEKNRKQFKNKTSKNKELFDYDWLNDEQDN